jgi:hypothetical protein
MGTVNTSVSLDPTPSASWYDGESNRGSMMLEFSILLPVLLVMIGGLLGMGVRLSNYMYLNQIARELVLKMATTPYVAQIAYAGAPSNFSFTVGPSTYEFTGGGSVISSDQAAACTTLLNTQTERCPGNNCSCPLQLLHYYASTLVKSKNIRVTGDVTMTFSFGPHPSAASGSGLCFLTVSLSASEAGWLTMAGGGLLVTASGPYLSGPIPTAVQNCRFP